MLSLEKIKENVSTGNISLGKLFSKQMLESAQNGDIKIFKEVYDQLDIETEDGLLLCYSENEYNKNEITMDTIFKTLIKTSIQQYDELILDYCLNESRFFKCRQYSMGILLIEEIKLCIYLNMFDFAKKLIDVTNSRNDYYYNDFMYKLISENSIPRLEFMVLNFEISDVYKFGFILFALESEKLISLKYLRNIIGNIEMYNSTLDQFNEISFEEINNNKNIENKQKCIGEVEQLINLCVNRIRDLTNSV